MTGSGIPPPVIRRLVLFGATGDLAGRYLLPALAALHAAGSLPGGFEVIGAARQDQDDEAFCRQAAERLDEHASEVPAAARDALVRSLRYRAVDLEDPASVASALDPAAGPVAAYLALPPGVFGTAVKTIGAVGLPPGSRIALEKPFGEDLDSAVALNELMARVLGDAVERVVFRVDHVLGLATVQNLLAMRSANAVVEAVWSSAHVEQVEILWEETLALEGRAGYYDKAGALKDVIQNHVIQALCLIAMAPPATLDELPDRKVEVLRSVRPLRPEDTRRARYTAGRIGTRPVPSYVDEDGVDAARCTETFAELELELDTPRWHGTRFVLRAGKALERRRKEAVIRFRAVPNVRLGDGAPAANELCIGLDGPEDIALRLTGAKAGVPQQLAPLTLSAEPPKSELPAYGFVLLDLLEGGSALSVRGDEAEEAWRVLTPVLDAWADGRVPLEEYPAGSAGLAPARKAQRAAGS
jgi:glucose-6-phosphate 1-dehydrogenase